MIEARFIIGGFLFTVMLVLCLGVLLMLCKVASTFIQIAQTLKELYYYDKDRDEETR